MNDFNINIRVMGQATGDLLSAASGKVKAGTESSSSGLGAHLVAMQKQQSKEGIAVLKSESKATKFQQRELLNSLLTAEKEAERWQKKDNEIMWKSIGKMDDDFRKTGVKQNNSLTKILGATLGMHVALGEFLKQLQSFFRILLLPMRLLGAFALMMLAKMGVLKGAADYAKGVGDLLFNGDTNPVTAFLKSLMGALLALVPTIVLGVGATILYQWVVGFFAAMADAIASGTIMTEIASGGAALLSAVTGFFAPMVAVLIAGTTIVFGLKGFVNALEGTLKDILSGDVGLALSALNPVTFLRRVADQTKFEMNQASMALGFSKSAVPWTTPGNSNMLGPSPFNIGTSFTTSQNTYVQGLNLGSSALQQFTEATMAATGTLWRNSKGEIVAEPTSTASSFKGYLPAMDNPNVNANGLWAGEKAYRAVVGENNSGYEGVYRPGTFTMGAAGEMVQGYLSQSAMMEANDAQLRTAAMAILQSTTPGAGAWGDQDSMAVLISRIEQALYSAQNAQAVVNIYGVTDSNLIDKINQYFQTSLRGRSSYGVQG